ncbi:MAG: 3-ketoacyl-ACP reductase [Planctomycetes bacterium]|nr:3-ketoacyl-ACP reductase [Planctomycetota bacterium]
MSERPLALVTGGSRGIGKGIALGLAKAGYNLVLNHVSPAGPALKETVSEMEAHGATVTTVQADIGNLEGHQKLIEECRKNYGRLDLLINNAGVAPKERLDILTTTQESYDRVLGINLKGPFFLTQAVANWMLEQCQENPERDCRIVNISSISAYTSSPNRAEYCLSKAGIGMMTALFADRLAEAGVGVFEVRPGVIATDMTGGVIDKYDKLIAEGLIPQKRWGKPDDIASCVVAIAEGRLDFCQGQVLNADGGFHLRRL